ncbi:MAG: response regulator transcription factor [Pseudomonadota bacterium]
MEPIQNPAQTHPSKILIVEDDRDLNRQMADLVRAAGHEVETCFDGKAGLERASRQQHQLMLLDLMLPRQDGISLLRSLRKRSQMPVIIVSAKGAEEERITGLRQGADDYISKPFNPTEMLLRIEALLRRSQPGMPSPGKSAVAIDNLLISLENNQVSVSGQALEFTQIQFKILWELGSKQGEVVSKAYLSQAVLNCRLGAYDRGLDMHVCRVRRKLNDVGWRGERLETVRGQGYCLK